jgi:tRNA 2-thiouridine synthesizing protein A
MATKVLDLKGLKCPIPQLKMSQAVITMQPGDIIEAFANCDTFEDDVRGWCDRTHKTLLWMREEADGVKRCQVQV